MKKIFCLAGLAALTLFTPGCYVPPPQVAVQSPAVVAPAPPPPTVYATYAPDYYTWDGNEYVGVSNGQYVYWSGATWIIAPPVVVGHFHGWERYHPDWHRHAMHYRHEQYR